MSFGLNELNISKTDHKNKIEALKTNNFTHRRNKR